MPRPMNSTAKATEIMLKCPTATAVKPAVSTRPEARVSRQEKTRRGDRSAANRMMPTQTKEATPAIDACDLTTSISS